MQFILAVSFKVGKTFNKLSISCCCEKEITEEKKTEMKQHNLLTQAFLQKPDILQLF